MKLNEKQKALLSLLREADARYREARLLEHEAARIAADQRILASLIERDKLAARSFAAGIPYSQIGKNGIHTTDRLTVKAAVERGSSFVDLSEPAEAEQTGRYAWDAQSRVLTVRMSAADFERYLPMLARPPKPEGEEWGFTLSANRLKPLGDDDVATWDNPVVTVVMADQRESLAYIEVRERQA